MNTSESINELAEALATAQGSFEAIPKRRKAEVVSKKTDRNGNPIKYSYKYADLGDAIDGTRKILFDNGLSVLQVPTVDDKGQMFLATRLMHKSGQWIEGMLPLDWRSGDPQALGSLLTYVRRYCYTGIIGVAAEEDDDGAMGKDAAQSRQEPRQPPKAPARASTPANGAARSSDAPAEPSAGRVAKAVAANRQPFDPEQGDELPPELGDPPVTVMLPDGTRVERKLTKALEWMKAKHADASIEHGDYWEKYYQPNVVWLERHAPKVASELAVRGG